MGASTNRMTEAFSLLRLVATQRFARMPSLPPSNHIRRSYRRKGTLTCRFLRRMTPETGSGESFSCINNLYFVYFCCPVCPQTVPFQVATHLGTEKFAVGRGRGGNGFEPGTATSPSGASSRLRERLTSEQQPPGAQHKLPLHSVVSVL